MAKNNKLKRIIKYIIIICIAILVVESFYLLYVYFDRESKNTYFDGINAIDKTKDGYIAVGSSDFKHSKDNSYTEGYENAKLAKYDSNKKLIWEVKYEKGYNATFYDVEVVSDGYIAVGSAEMSKKQNKENLRNAIIVKYDFNGKMVFEKEFHTLDDSKFTKVKNASDGIYVVGRSVFAPMEIGVSQIGGGILAKYDYDGNEIFHSNYGGSKSGVFNDLVISNDSLYLVGKDANTGILVKYSLDGQRQWVKNYSYTDSLGFSGIAEDQDQLIVVGAKKTTDVETDYDSDALLLKYDKNGKLLMEKTYTVLTAKWEEDKVDDTTVSMDRYNGVVVDDNHNIIVIGQTTKKDLEESNSEKNVFRYNGLFMIYNKDGKLKEKREFGGERDDYFTGIIKDQKQYCVFGYANSKDNDLKYTGRNNKDFKSLIIEFDLSGKLINVK